MLKSFLATNSLLMKRVSSSSATTTLAASFTNTHHISPFLSMCSSLTQQQVRERKKQTVRRKLPSDKEVFDKFLEGPKEKYLHPPKKVKDTSRNALRPATFEILIIKDNKLTFAGEVVRMKSSKAWRYLASNPPKAVMNTPENREKYKHLLANPEELAQKRETFNRRYILQRCVIKMWRKTEGGNMKYYWPITKRDVANYVWCVHHLALRDEDITFPGEQKNNPSSYHPINKPGYYCLHADLHDGKAPVLLRLYLPLNDKAKTHRGNSLIGYK
ncbi:hypothetical protein C9374_011399 [Naegleria lovaniensis]|uniref:Uncharacterized protein n=1 Tax=Naegleria lovaniensis TaxID=51637 RepID=A0AA88H2Y1_NAELO|nr:uncharacterized protein C9374_011399 [Naegleria lovaniensis]KAG2392674.1 hypothetical protein C9374_011399 [Naegleria lovaniensis]